MKKIRYLLYILLVSCLLFVRVSVKALDYTETSVEDEETGVITITRTYNDTDEEMFQISTHKLGANIYTVQLIDSGFYDIQYDIGWDYYAEQEYIDPLYSKFTLYGKINGEFYELISFAPDRDYYINGNFSDEQIKSLVLDDAYQTFSYYYIANEYLLDENTTFDLYLEVSETESTEKEKTLQEYVFIYNINPLTIEVETDTYDLGNYKSISNNDVEIVREYEVPTSAAGFISHLLPPNGRETKLRIKDMNYFDQIFSEFEGYNLEASSFTLYKDFAGTSIKGLLSDEIKDEYSFYCALNDYLIGQFEDIDGDFQIGSHLVCELGFNIESPYAGKYVKFIFNFKDFDVAPIEDGEILTLYCQQSIYNAPYLADPEFHSYLQINLTSSIFEYYEPEFVEQEVEEPISVRLITNDKFVYGTIPFDDVIWDEEGDGAEYGTLVAFLELENAPTEPITFQAIIEFYSRGELISFKSNKVEIKPLNVGILIDGLSSTDEIQVGEEHELSFALTTKVKTIHDFRITQENQNFEIAEVKKEIKTLDDAKTTIKASDVDKTTVIVNMEYEVDDYTEIMITSYREIKSINVVPEKIDIDASINIYSDNNEEKVNEAESDSVKKVSYDNLEGLKGVVLNDFNNLILGGPKVLFYVYVDPKLDDGSLEYNWSVANGALNVIKLETCGNAVIIEATGAGKQKINLDITGYTIGTVHKEFGVNVVDLTNADITLTYPKEFHKSGESITVDLAINGTTDFLNLDVDFKVSNKDGEYDKITKDKTKVTINSPVESNYTVTATIESNFSFESYSITSDPIEVRNVDLNKLITQLLPLIAIAMVILIMIAITIKKNADQSHSLDRILDKACGAIEKANPEEEDYQKNLLSCLRKLRRALNKEEDLTIENSGQYDNLIVLNRKAIKTLEGLVRTNKKLDAEQKKAALDVFKEQLYKLLKLSVDLETARKKLNDERNKVGRTAITEIKKEEPVKKGKKK